MFRVYGRHLKGRSLLVMCMYLLWSIKNCFERVFVGGGSVNKTIKSEQLTLLLGLAHLP